MTGSDPIEGVSKDVTSYRLSTGKFLASLIQPDKDVVDSQNTTTQEDSETDANLPQIDASILRWMPTIIFVLSAAVSFSTGTSWGTMALVMPIAISLTFPLLADDRIPRFMKPC